MENASEGGNGSQNVNANESNDQLGEASLSTAPRERNNYHRHTAQQIQRLEGFFQECQHPNKDQRQQLSQESGLNIKQIQFWFQNKRTQMKVLNERADNDSLRQENERLHCENLKLAEALQSGICLKCKYSPQEEGSLSHIQRLKLNEELRKKIADMREHGAMNAGENGLEEIDENMLIETAAKAMEELLELLQTDEPLWMRCPNDPDKLMIHRQSYNMRFPNANGLKSSSSLFESSKVSAEVNMNATDLLKLFMHPTDWVDLFPTIITRANTLRIVESQQLSGSMHVMHEQMHIFSPVVPPREFAFLRYCNRLDPSSWVIVDVSYACCIQMNQASPSRYWKLPSGCKIQILPNGNSKVTWVEHVEVDKGTETHCLFGDLLHTAQAYGANIWLANLQRTCERLLGSSGWRPAHAHQLEEVINIPEGRRSIMKLANKMVKNFCEILTMKDKVDFPQLGEMNNNGVQISIRSGIEFDQSVEDMVIISGAASFWLPLSCPTLFAYFTREDFRPQWDVLFSRNGVNEVAHISCGNHPWNCISIFRPSVPNQQETFNILQESGIDSCGAYVIYAAVAQPTYTMAVSGEDTSQISLQPCGITIISGDDSRFRNCSTSVSPQPPQHHSLVTVALQNLKPQHCVKSAVETVTTFLNFTIWSIKAALDH